MFNTKRDVIAFALLAALLFIGCDDGSEIPRECTPEDAASCVESCHGEGYNEGGVLAEVDCSCVCMGPCTTKQATYSCGYMAISGDCPQNVVSGVMDSQCGFNFDGTEVCGPWQLEEHFYDEATQCDLWYTFRGQTLGYGIYDNWLDIALLCPDIDCHHTFQIYIN
jgi:hypothetical protein